MKKTLIIVSFCMLIALVGCNSNNDNEVSNSSIIEELKLENSNLKDRIEKLEGEFKDNKINSNENIDNKKDKGSFTLEEIKNQYDSDNIKNITEYTGKFSKVKYVLIEVKEDTLANRFVLYNLRTGDKDVLPTYPYYVKFEKIESENRIIFINEGTNHISPHREFPSKIICIRDEENPNREDDFLVSSIEKKLYFKLDRSVNFGLKGKEVIKDIRVTLTGIEVLFEPVEGYESDFYAGDTMLPVTETSYDEKNKEFILRFKDTKITENLKYSNFQQNNYYIKSIKVTEEGENSLIILNIDDTAKYYTGVKKDTFADGGGFPYLSLEFIKEIY